ncbi:uncharacterized protein B0T15DRAFT_423432 [Chaetomium strumarium]|uniref:MOSC domain-containing protein n=1 Tax=Chaetomium strumarium TaxID=1170767 RepID=A0AAJ0GKL4_9PEZI|nr:hypothetical protein B0T15DRAFT_423432 [Chaetomium strumarium]
MKVSALYVYPIKGLRGIELKKAQIGPQGISHDRRFMLWEVHSSTGELKKVQVDSHPRGALFEQRIVSGPQQGEAAVVVQYHGELPSEPEASGELEDEILRVPLEPDISSLQKKEVVLHGSPASAYRMGDSYDSWFSRRFGVSVILVYLGDGRRAVLGKTLPPKPAAEQQQKQQRGWMASLASYIAGSDPQSGQNTAPWITFADVAPLLVTSESSLGDVRDRLLNGRPVEMHRFRPNVVVDGDGEEAWAEDFWAELAIVPGQSVVGEDGDGDGLQRGGTLLLTGNCVRCTSLNVDYETGKPAEGELGQVLKRLMKDRRVDLGSKWSPVFGRYAFLGSGHAEGFTVSVGDEVQVTRRNTERTVWDWPGL